MSGQYYPGNLQWLGLAKETTPGTPVAAPTAFIPVTSPVWSPKITTLTDQALRGYMGNTYHVAQGIRYDEIGYTTYLYDDNLFIHLLAILGGVDAVTGSADPYTHKVSLNNGTAAPYNAAPPSYTLFLAMGGNKTYQVPGCMLADVKINAKADTLPSLQVTWDGLPGSSITSPANTPSTSQPYPAWKTQATVGGVALSDTDDVQLDYKRGLKPIPVLNGTNSPMGIYAGELEVSGTLEAVWQGTSDANLQNLLTNSQPSLQVTFAPANSTTHGLTLQHSVVAYTASDPKGANNGWMTISSTFTALMNPTDALDGTMSPAQAIFTTATAEAY
jgi:hypothetical protein